MALKSLGVAASSSSDLATKGYVDGLAFAGAPPAGFLEPVICTAKGGETFTISAGSVTQIAGTTVCGVTMAVGHRILIQGAPTSTGAGVDYNNSDSAANGLYEVTGTSGGNTQVARTADMSGSVNPLGLCVFIIDGDWIPSSFITVTSTTNYSSFTYGTDRMYWEGTGGRNLNINSAYFAAKNQTMAFANGSGRTYFQATPNAGNQSLLLPPGSTGTIYTGGMVHALAAGVFNP